MNLNLAKIKNKGEINGEINGDSKMNPYYVASLSYGKDSLAMLLKILELKLPLDEVIHVQVMFDESISGNQPEQQDFIEKVDKILFDKYGIKVNHLKAKKHKPQYMIF